MYIYTYIYIYIYLFLIHISVYIDTDIDRYIYICVYIFVLVARILHHGSSEIFSSAPFGQGLRAREVPGDPEPDPEVPVVLHLLRATQLFLSGCSTELQPKL